jgi:hypothetical protein
VVLTGAVRRQDQAAPQEGDVDRVRLDLALAAVEGIFDAEAAELAAVVPGLIEESARLGVGAAHGPPAESAYPFGLFTTNPTPHRRASLY